MYYRILLIVTILSILLACQAPQINTSSPQPSLQAQLAISNVMPVAYEAIKAKREEAFKQKVLSKKTTAKAYTLTLDSTWHSTQENEHVLTLEKTADAFKTQSKAPETVVYEETLKLEDPSLSVEKEIAIDDIGKRYSFFLTSSQRDVKVTVKLNGQILPLTQNEQNELLVTAQNIPLLPLNTLQFVIDGNPQDMVRVALIKGESTGTVLRQHKDTLLSPSNLQQIQSWDPFRGDIEYLNGGESIRLSRSRLNENELIFQTGVVQAEFESESARLQFESLYGAKVIDETRIGDEVVYLMTLNLERAPLPQVFELLHAYNQGIPVDIESVNFSSVAAMQTFVIMLDAMTNHSCHRQC